MTVILWVTTAVCFIVAILALAKKMHAESCIKRLEAYHDTQAADYRSLRDYYIQAKCERDELRKTLARVAEAVKAERQLQYERTLEWRVTLDRGVETVLGLRTLLRQDGETVVTTKFVDEFIAHYLPAETVEPEE